MLQRPSRLGCARATLDVRLLVTFALHARLGEVLLLRCWLCQLVLQALELKPCNPRLQACVQGCKNSLRLYHDATLFCPRAAGSYDHFLNFQIVFVILLQLALCVFCAIASIIWRQLTGIKHYNLALQDNVQVRTVPLLKSQSKAL